MAAETRMQQSQRALEEQLRVILQTLERQDTGAVQRHEQLQTELATLTQNLQEQGYKLEAQKACYDELKQQVHGLSVSQTEQQQNMGLQLREVQQQVKSLEDAHAQDMKRAGEKLEATDATLEALGSDLQKLSSAHEARCRSMEDGLLELKEKTHQRLEQVWEILQLKTKDLGRELMAEIAKLPSPTISTHGSSLSPSAPTFVPPLDLELSSATAAETGTATATVTDTLAAPTMPDLPLPTSVPSLDVATHSRTAIGVTTEGGAGPAKPVQRAPPYDGRADWDAYRTQFEMLANFNRWTEVEKATYLAVSLKGPALTVLSNLPADNLYNYSSLVTALDACFGSSHQAELHRMKLSRIRRREEGLAELAEDIERLARLAYPTAPSTMLELLAKDQFIDALQDGDMRLRLRQAHPKSLREALQSALELEAFQLASQHRAKPVRGATLEGEEQQPDSPPRMAFPREDLTECIQQCMQTVCDNLQKKKTEEKVNNPAPGRWRGRRTIRGNCWSCGKPGHMQIHCSESSGNSTTFPSNSAASGKRELARLEGQSLAGESNAPQDVFKTGAGLGPSNGLCAVGAIGGKRCQIIVDTGSNISIVHPDILKQAGISVIPTTGRLRTVTGETAPLQGRKTVQLTVGTFQTPHAVWVAEIADECIIGMDFLQSHGCLVNLKEGILQIGEEEVPLRTPQGSEPNCYRCCAGSSVTLLPKSETLIPAQVEGD